MVVNSECYTLKDLGLSNRQAVELAIKSFHITAELSVQCIRFNAFCTNLILCKQALSCRHVPAQVAIADNRESKIVAEYNFEKTNQLGFNLMSASRQQKVNYIYNDLAVSCQAWAIRVREIHKPGISTTSHQQKPTE